MINELTKKFNEAMQTAVFDQNSKCENEVDISNVKPIDKTDKEHVEKLNEELMQKAIDIDRYFHEQQRKCRPAIIIDSQGRYVNTYGCGTASILDYIKAVEEGQIKIKDKEYRKSILKFIENNK